MVWIWGLERSYGVTTVACSGVQKALRFELGYAALHNAVVVSVLGVPQNKYIYS
jgi:hypothetical protein